jgi:hypothetical protein
METNKQTKKLLPMSSVISKTQIPPSRKKYYSAKKKGDNSVGIVIGLQAASPGNLDQIINFSSPKFHVGYGAKPASYLMGTG